MIEYYVLFICVYKVNSKTIIIILHSIPIIIILSGISERMGLNENFVIQLFIVNIIY